MIDRNEIIRMALEAGLLEIIDDAYQARADWSYYVERFAALVAAAEREACAKLVEASSSYDWHPFACEAATAIRARGTK